MVDADVSPFVALLRDVYGLYPAAKPLTEGQVAMFVRALRQHPLPAVRAGLDAHVRDPQRGRFPPLPADVIAQIDGDAENDGRPGVEEAWAMSLAGRDERETVVWTAEMAAAWSVCLSVLNLGDEVGARMAFREAYARLVGAARCERMPAAWTASLGFDAERRRAAIEAAVQCGRLPRSELLALPAPGNVSLLALAFDGGSTATEQQRQALRDLAERLRNAPAPASAADSERRRLDALKADADAKVQAYQTGAAA